MELLTLGLIFFRSKIKPLITNTLARILVDFRPIFEESSAFHLYQNRPNPFDEITTISFDLPESGNATIILFDATGYNELIIEGKQLPRGMIFYSLESGVYQAIRKMLLIK